MRNPGDIFTEPSNIDVNTLKNLGPLSEMAGIWEGSRSLDIPPKPLSAPVRQAFIEHTELQPIDPQANGPQLFYGLRYHTHIVKPGEVETPTNLQEADGTSRLTESYSLPPNTVCSWRSRSSSLRSS